MIALVLFGIISVLMLCAAFMLGWMTGWMECEKKAEADGNNERWRRSDGE